MKLTSSQYEYQFSIHLFEITDSIHWAVNVDYFYLQSDFLICWLTWLSFSLWVDAEALPCTSYWRQHKGGDICCLSTSQHCEPGPHFCDPLPQLVICWEAWPLTHECLCYCPTGGSFSSTCWPSEFSLSGLGGDFCSTCLCDLNIPFSESSMELSDECHWG
jgi:hypothetical protein